MEPCRPPDEFAIPSGDWVRLPQEEYCYYSNFLIILFHDIKCILQSWASNWRIDKKPGTTDSDGWEYASKMIRFRDMSSNKDRRARAEMSVSPCPLDFLSRSVFSIVHVYVCMYVCMYVCVQWNDTARRRLWLRIMRREVGIAIRNVADVHKTLPKVQNGLTRYALTQSSSSGMSRS
jgi:hypothetical protein